MEALVLGELAGHRRRELGVQLADVDALFDGAHHTRLVVVVVDGRPSRADLDGWIVAHTSDLVVEEPLVLTPDWIGVGT